MRPGFRQFLSFFSVIALIIGAVHFYVFTHIVRYLGLVGGQITAAMAVTAAIFVITMANLPLSRLLPRRWASPLAWVVFTWLGTLMYLLLVFLATDIGELLFGHALHTSDWSPQSWRLLGTGALGLVAVLVALALWGARRLKVQEVAVTLARLPEALRGLRVAQLTDLHVGATINGNWLRRVVARVNALEPDIVVITGDLVDGSVAELREHVAPLRDLKARQGVFFVTGNHEYYSGADAWISYLRTLGVRVLRNERVTLTHAGAAIDLAGVDDFMGRSLPGHGPDFVSAVGNREADHPVILLAHQPRAIHDAAAHGVDLVLSGHTHGGQMWPWRYLVPLQQPYVTGLHRHEEGDTQIYISAGTGYWGPPMRLGTRAEITHITLY